MIGTKLAHYEITSHLGSGGMGDVYQANDSKLGRSVAIKFLPEAFTHDAERAARFEREARVLASLNHSNIAAIHGLEESGERKFLVMELVPGETLADRIKRGPIPVDESLQIAKQICEALEAAHDKGIIHRDLKPANVKITPDGKVKVLDFGLAKAFENEPANAALSNSPTLSMAATNAGVILGTAAYMSPEQAKGLRVDLRTDIFAFGAVLYEMLTRHQAFAGETVAEILAAVIRSDPEWGRLPVDTPPGIRRLLRRCLQKDRNRRLQAVADGRIEIEEASTDLAPSEYAPLRSRERLAWIAALIIILTIAVTVTVAVLVGRPAKVLDAPETRTDIVTPATSDPISLALSPDGRNVVFVASGDGPARLWLRPLNSAEGHPLTGTDGASFPFWSPDSRSVGFFSEGQLKRIDIVGGPPRTLAAAPVPRGGAWSDDGVILFAPVPDGGLFRVPAGGGETVPFLDLVAREGSARFPQFLPGSRQFLFYNLPLRPQSQFPRGIYLASMNNTTESKLLTEADTAGVLLPPDWLLFVQSGKLVARRLDVARGQLVSDGITIADPVMHNAAIFSGAFSVSSAGLAAYRAGGAARRQLVWYDRTGKPLGVFGGPNENDLREPQLSPDGRRVAVNLLIQGNRDVWLLDNARTTRFTFDANQDWYPIWSPLGTQIVFRSNRKRAYDLYLKQASGAADSEEILYESKQDKIPTDWSRDGRFILYTNADPKTGNDLWILSVEDRTSRVFVNTNFDESYGQFSPDGRWVAYQSNESGKYQVVVRPFSGIGEQYPVSATGGVSPRWQHEGKEIYFIAPDGTLMASEIHATKTTFEANTPVALFPTRIWFGGTPVSRPQYDVAPDGRFLINVGVEEATTAPITLLQNWKPKS